MASADGQLQITFNGEIYNYRELRAELQAKGYRFVSTSDTEVLLHLYRERGPEMVRVLRGMFAFGIWDERRKGLFLARDPFGVKPLYFADDGRTLRFASQVKALLAGGNIDTTPSAAGRVGFYLWGSVPEPHTFYRGIRALHSGTTLWIERGLPRTIRRYYSISSELSHADEVVTTRPGERRKLLRAALVDSVRAHMIADVPVGVFLSAGLDSSTIMALASEVESSRITALTLGFKEYEGTAMDEVPLARSVAHRYGALHHVDVISAKDLETELDRLLRVMDQPTIDGINTFFVSRAASRAGMKVALSGIGGDEMFGGYPSFREIPRLVRAVQSVPGLSAAGRTFRFVSAPILRRLTSPKYAGMFEYGGTYGGAYLLRRGLFMPWELPRLMDPDMAAAGWNELQPIARLDRRSYAIETPHARVAAMELRTYMRNQLLRDADWAGMAWSLEIRVPLVDPYLFRTVVPWMGLEHPPTKQDMAAAPSNPLPPEVLTRGKTGFSIPVQEWLSGHMGVAAERGYRGWARMLAG
jgi:asparagine synthase (glutamine-hydrolysing)